MLVQLFVALALLNPTTVQDKKEDKIDAKLLIGKWEPEMKPDQVESMSIEYTKDNKMKVAIKVQGMDLNFEGTYKVDGNKLSFEMNVQGEERKEKRTIVKLTEKEMVTNDEAKSEERKFKKVK